MRHGRTGLVLCYAGQLVHKPLAEFVEYATSKFDELKPLSIRACGMTATEYGRFNC